MTFRLAIVALSLAIAAPALVAAPTPAFAQEDERAQARAAFERGVGLFDDGSFQEALTSFQEAYRLRPHPSVRVNMANCYEELGRPMEAIQHFERFLLEAESARPAQIREVRATVARLRGSVGEVFIRVTPEGATVTIDGGDSRRTPILDAIGMTAGTHHIEVSMGGFATQAVDVVVEGGGRSEVAVTLEEAASEPEGSELDLTAPDPAGTGDEDEHDDDATTDSGGGLNLSTPVIISGSATIGLALIGVVTGIMAVGANSDFDDSLAAFEASGRTDEMARQAALDDEDRANRLAIVTDVMLFTALAGAGVTAYFLFFYDDGDSDEAVAGRTLRAVPAATPDSAGVILEGTF